MANRRGQRREGIPDRVADAPRFYHELQLAQIESYDDARVEKPGEGSANQTLRGIPGPLTFSRDDWGDNHDRMPLEWIVQDNEGR